MEETKHLEENDQLNQLSMNILVHAGNARDHLVHSLESLEDTLMTAQSEILIGEHLVRLFEAFSQK